ncbi:energy transducer TonB family protein [Bacterioplanoides pacificum]|uniref:Energy transducer TonB n=1 Tax=Bacterioplanoides pacificum TaxID=1171596 RepID=A0ABV7VV36_9GAMM
MPLTLSTPSSFAPRHGRLLTTLALSVVLHLLALPVWLWHNQPAPKPPTVLNARLQSQAVIAQDHSDQIQQQPQQASSQPEATATNDLRPAVNEAVADNSQAAEAQRQVKPQPQPQPQPPKVTTTATTATTAASEVTATTTTATTTTATTTTTTSTVAAASKTTNNDPTQPTQQVKTAETRKAQRQQIYDPQELSYVQQLIAHLNRKLVAPAQLHGQVRLQLTIRYQQIATRVEVLQSSGDPATDDWVVKAVLAANPFPPVPDHLPQPYVFSPTLDLDSYNAGQTSASE